MYTNILVAQCYGVVDELLGPPNISEMPVWRQYGDMSLLVSASLPKGMIANQGGQLIARHLFAVHTCILLEI